MKILLANPPCKISINKNYEKYFIRAGSRWPHSGIKRKGILPHYLPFPFFLGYSAGLLLMEKFEVQVLDAVALDITEEEFCDGVRFYKPDLVFFETTTPTIENDIKLINRIKDSDKQIVIVIGGTHATTYAGGILSQCNNIDYVIKGEYEMTLLNLCKLLSSNTGGLDGIKGLVYRKNINSSEIVDNGHAELIDPLDQLPFPGYNLFPRNENSNPTIYWDGFCQYRPALQMHASRGCPYGCYFCIWPQVMYNSRKYRKFSPSRVVDEAEYLIKNYNIKEIYFDDDDFTIDRKHVLNICEEIKKRNLKVKWSCMGDAINLDEEVISSMASSGCIGMKFGVESANREILKDIGKPVVLEKVKEISNLCVKYGMKTHATFSIGLMGETKETLKESLEFAKQIDVDTIQVSICTPYPGTKFFSWAEEKGILKKDFKWSDFDGSSKTIIEYSNLDSEYLECFRKYFFNQWLLSKIMHPKWLLRQVRNIFRVIRGQGAGFLLSKLWGVIINTMSTGRRSL